MSERKHHTQYQTPTAAFAGLPLAKKGAQVQVRAADLNGERPEKGDRLRLDTGEWLVVEKVGELSEGAYPLTVKPEGGK